MLVDWFVESLCNARTFSCFAVASIVFYIVRCFIEQRELVCGARRIPGPMGLPIFGYLPFMSGSPHVHLWSLVQRYGKIYRISMAGFDTVVLTDPYLIKDAFRQKVFSARPSMFIRNDIVRNRGE